MPFQFRPLEIPAVILIEARAFDDERGFFMETYQRTAFSEADIPGPFVQDNYSHSTRGVFRGLHYQNPPMAQGKLVQAISGEILDVAVDIRKGSPTFGEYVTATLSHKNHRLLFVPAGFAHGFCSLSDEADVVYKVTNEYSPQHDRGILWSDPAIGLDLPIAEPLLSQKDRELPMLGDADNGFDWEEEG
ncbi:MAG: dTDP-4-dehydrorhamnose 3,5-epimerase [Actinobacteria bacterium]|nr:dTDP-4-dehydrorhamnose 3,5-epimerase [Actinomycetota bacterium]